MCTHHEEPSLSRRGMLLRGGALAALGLLPALGCVKSASAGPGEPMNRPLRATAAGGPGPQAAPGGRWARPLTEQHAISAAYGIEGDWLAGRHTGIDFAVDTGTPLFSVGPGTVDIAGDQGDYGKAVLVRMDDGHFILYAHMSSLQVSRGGRVTGGSRLGNTGASGRVSGPHLHFEVRTTRNYGTDIDPTKYLAARGVRIG
ncbi:M23 family metallopeptidase [Streptomyces sp. XM4193]|uniref:M23 family metallopeptidase n=1 Tax=Streptomyces sp. XM4193 TaxID=2929782 RepID=UPI001FFBB844|nr:M23 family metallopeptidase [Streptomyces sp. XM4193]MCK1798552.1 M23 family metallopeptidase [Streptomyces sp. XM4193]